MSSAGFYLNPRGPLDEETQEVSDKPASGATAGNTSGCFCF